MPSARLKLSLSEGPKPPLLPIKRAEASSIFLPRLTLLVRIFWMWVYQGRVVSSWATYSVNRSVLPCHQCSFASVSPAARGRGEIGLRILWEDGYKMIGTRAIEASVDPCRIGAKPSTSTSLALGRDGIYGRRRSHCGLRISTRLRTAQSENLSPSSSAKACEYSDAATVDAVDAAVAVKSVDETFQKQSADAKFSYAVDANGWRIIDWKAIPVPVISRDGDGDSAASRNLTDPMDDSTDDIMDKDYNVSLTQVASYHQLHPMHYHPAPSPVELLLVRDRRVYVKRDDLLRLPHSNVSGNKARKFLSMNALPSTNFPDVVVSYGGPQSNAMLALAAVVHSKDLEAKAKGGGLIQEPSSRNVPKRKRFVYYTKKLPRWLRKTPSGNFLRATSLGMEVVELSHDDYARTFGGEHGGSFRPPEGINPPPIPGNSVWIPQGGACGVSMLGVQGLAREIVEFWKVERGESGAPLAVVLPGGTGTTSLFLKREVDAAIHEERRDEEKTELNISVVVVPCVGNAQYLRRQMTALDKATGGTGAEDNLPLIFEPLLDGKYRKKGGTKPCGYFVFGEPKSKILDTYKEMKDEHGVCLDLLYGSPAWSLVLEQWRIAKDYPYCTIAGKQIMYIHTGGLEGTSSQLTRYKHKGLISPKELQQ